MEPINQDLEWIRNQFSRLSGVTFTHCRNINLEKSDVVKEFTTLYERNNLDVIRQYLLLKGSEYKRDTIALYTYVGNALVYPEENPSVNDKVVKLSAQYIQRSSCVPVEVVSMILEEIRW